MVRLSKRCLMSEVYEVYMDQCQTYIYYSWGKSKKLIQKQDKVVLEALFQEIFNK